MKSLFEWFKTNTATVFTFLGIFLTIFFSIFYIPGYIKEMKNEKINNVNNSLIESIQELVYNNQKIEKRSFVRIRKVLAEIIELSRNIKKPNTTAEYPSSLNTNAKRALYDNLAFVC